MQIRTVSALDSSNSLAHEVPRRFFTHMIQLGDVHVHRSGVPHMAQVIVVREEAGYIISDHVPFI